MPEGTPVERLYKKLLDEGHSEESAARIAQAQTGLSLKTGKPAKHENTVFMNFDSTVSKTKWRKTPEGFLRCTAQILQNKIMPYLASELGDSSCNVPNSNVINMFVPLEQMSDPESLKSLEGIPLVSGQHEWLTTENAKDFIIGSVSGTPRIENGFIKTDFLITDPDTITKIENSEYVDVSAAYTANSVFVNGEFDGNPYQAEQRQLRYNHIAIIPPGTGRAGSDVRITNKKRETEKMSDKMIVKLVNTGVNVSVDEDTALKLQNEMDASKKKEEEMEKKGEKEDNGKDEIENALKVTTDKNVELQNSLDAVTGELAVLKNQVSQLSDPAVVANAAKEMIELANQANVIVENTVKDSAALADVKTKIANMTGAELRAEVMNVAGLEVEGMNEDVIKGAFAAQYHICNSNKATGTTVAGTKMMNTVGKTAGRSAQEKLGFGK